MALDLSKLTIGDAELPNSQRGRKATPIPVELLDAVKASYSMPKGSGKSVTVSADEADVKALKGFLRRAAVAQGMGISISDGKVTKTTHTVLFRAKDKNKSTPKPTDIYVVASDEGVEWVEPDVEGARLASVTEAKALGFTHDGESWIAPDPE